MDIKEDNKGKGFIKLFRSLLDWEWHDDPNTLTVFIHCLLLANYKDSKWHGKDIPKGCFVSSISSLAKKTGLSEKSVRTAVKHLKEAGNLASESTNRYTIFKVENYDLYQDGGEQDGSQGAGKGQAKGRQRATSKESKKERNKEIKNLDDHSGQAADDDQDELFDFYKEVQKAFSNQDVVQSLNAYWAYWKKKPKKDEALRWIKTLQAMPDDATRLASIRYSSGGSGKWYRDIYTSGFSDPRKGTQQNLPGSWKEEPQTGKPTQEEIDEVLRIQKMVLQGRENE